jgi:shikimate dehydrogenase
MHKAALAHFGLEGDYHPIDLDEKSLRPGLTELFKQGLTGFNVTIPHKETIFAMKTQSSAEAERVQAANTVRFLPDGQMFVHNTDLDGFKIALNEFLNLGKGNVLKQSDVFVLGAGGAARAALVALSDLGFSKTIIVARNQKRSAQLISSMKQHHAQELQYLDVSELSTRFIHSVPVLIINSTPLGQQSAEIPSWFFDLLSHTQGQSLFFDMVYAKNNEATPLVKIARERGLTATDGTEMLVQQAALSFEFWTGHKPPIEIMRKALNNANNR